jgi:hypothetical protein
MGKEAMATVSLGSLQLHGPAYHRPGLDLPPLPPGPPHEYASSVLCAPGVFASAFLPLAGAGSL